MLNKWLLNIFLFLIQSIKEFMNMNQFFKKAIITTCLTSGVASFAFADRGHKDRYRHMEESYFKNGYYQKMHHNNSKSPLKKETAFIKDALLPATSLLKKAYYQTHNQVLMEVTGDSLKELMKERRVLTQEEQTKYKELFEKQFHAHIDKAVKENILTQQQADRAKYRVKDQLTYSQDFLF